MTQVIADTPREAPAAADLTAAVHQVLAASPEPLTLSKIRAALPAPFRNVTLEELGETLRRQVAASAIQQFPKYRSQQDRFWDRPMAVHVIALIQSVLESGSLALSQLRRKLPAYAAPQLEPVLHEQVAQGRIFVHPPLGNRGSERFGLRPADAKDYLRSELPPVLRRVQQLGFNETQVREAAMELLQEEEWSWQAEPEQPAEAAETSPRVQDEPPPSASEPPPAQEQPMQSYNFPG